MKKYDVAIIGSGAAGSVMAWRLVNKGLSVVVLERGRREDPSTFTHSELEMMPRVYKHGGLQSSADNDLVIMQGCTVGGSTVINNAIWVRADLDRVLPEWSRMGAPLERQWLEDGYEDMERVLRVAPLPIEVANAGTPHLLRGGAQSGLPVQLLKHNRSECLGCGWCNYGCRYGRKTSMLVTLIPWAEEKGAVFLDRCANVRFLSQNGRVFAVDYEDHEGRSERVRAERFVVSAGAIGSSEVLLNSGIEGRGTVGRGFHVLGGVLVTGEMEQRLDAYDGIGLTTMAHTRPDYVVESFFCPPGAFAASAPGWFEDHAARMSNYTNAIQAGVMVGTAPRGSITVRSGKPTRIDLKFDKAEVIALREGIKDIARIFFAAGARTVHPSLFHPLPLRSEAELPRLNEAVRRADDMLLGSAHPQGGNVINEDPARGVVGPDLRVHGYENLFVADASVFPSNIRVNCQATVMAVSHYAARFVSA